MAENSEPEEPVVGLPDAESIAFSEVSSVQAREPLTAQHLWAALHFAQLCKRQEDEITKAGRSGPYFPHRAYAMAAVKFSVSFLESLVNDLYSDAADPYMSTSGRMKVLAPEVISELADIWVNAEADGSKTRIQLLDKYQTALSLAGAARFAKNENTYCAAADLIFLRNELVHFKVGWQKVGASQNEASHIERRLKPKFATNQQLIGDPWFPNKCLGAGCARWACTAAGEFADEWLSRLALPQDYKQAVRDLGTY
ncbi:hypothetical protein [Nocardia wallacei]|uniref:hypothetical protein n=1 Tax=Nocardia wallacei TaxID=480035 RepID=UPI0024540D14|nr:hypothetical protein [Nocardia wallacei]